MSLHEEKIKLANEQINKYRDQISQGIYRQNIHFCAPVGWLNDPNGFIKYKGEYHLFYQFNPYKPYWGSMHWGHAKSKDLITWEHLPVALAPSELYDNDEKGGCFSGTTIEKDGKLYVFYTGVVVRDEKVIQTQNLAYSEDGINFQKYSNNPIVEIDYPGTTSETFRDPKVWENGNGYHMIVGTTISGKGNALYYQSNDLLNWQLIGPIMEYSEDFGFMWECPDFFEIDGKDVLLFSPMGMGETTTIYFIGKMDYEHGTFIHEHYEVIDYGFDFYAPQSIEDAGRRLMIGWQNGWEWMPWWNGFGPTSEVDHWCGSMSIPREVTLKDNKLFFNPIKEIDKYEKNQFSYKDIEIWKEPTLLTSEIGECFVMKVDTKDVKGKLTVEVSNVQEGKDIITIEEDCLFYMSKNNPFGKSRKKMPLLKEELLFYFDSCSLEIFSSDSGKVFSVNNFLKKGKRKIILYSEDPITLKRVIVTEMRT
jgi:beta-fructofuranosidase